MDATMDEYDRGVHLEEENRELKNKNRELGDEINKHKKDLAGKSEDLRLKDDELIRVTKDCEQLRYSLSDAKSKLDEQTAAADTIDQHLTNAYTDLNRTQTALQTALKAKDAADEQQKETELQLASLHAEWEEAQEKIAELETSASGLQHLEESNAALHEDMESLRDHMGTHERTLHVKDARIQHLEIQLQQALQGKLDYQAAVEAAASPTEHAPVVFGTNESLEFELAGTSDYDSDSWYGHEDIELSPVITVADIHPIAPPAITLTTAFAEAASFAPTVSDTSSAQTQTTEPILSKGIFDAVGTTPVAPTLSTHFFETANFAPASPSTSSAQTQTLEPDLSMSLFETASFPPTTPATASAETQTSAPALARVLFEAVSTAPVAPSTAQKSVQTESILPDLSIALFENASLSPAVPNASLTTAYAEAASIAPVASSTSTVQTQTIGATVSSAGVQTEVIFPSQAEIKCPTFATAVVQTEDAASVMTSITSIETQTAHTQTDGFLTEENSIRLSKPQRAILSGYVFWLLAIFMALISLNLYAEQQAYYSANNRNTRSINGAFGSPRYLFGVVPFGFDIGGSWLSEEFARFSSATILRVEHWLGTTPTPLY